MNKKINPFLDNKFQFLLLITQVLLIIITLSSLYRLSNLNKEIDDKVWLSLQNKFGTDIRRQWFIDTTTRLGDIEETQKKHTLILENIEIFTTY